MLLFAFVVVAASTEACVHHLPIWCLPYPLARLSSILLVSRSGSLVDKFNNRGGNGGKPYIFNCGVGFRISGYDVRCGSLVDRIKLRCSPTPRQRTQVSPDGVRRILMQNGWKSYGHGYAVPTTTKYGNL